MKKNHNYNARLRELSIHAGLHQMQLRVERRRLWYAAALLAIAFLLWMSTQGGAA